MISSGVRLSSRASKVSFDVICFSSVKKILIYDTISPTPHGKGRIMVGGGVQRKRDRNIDRVFLYDVLNPAVGWLRRS